MLRGTTLPIASLNSCLSTFCVPERGLLSTIALKIDKPLKRLRIFEYHALGVLIESETSGFASLRAPSRGVTKCASTCCADALGYQPKNPKAEWKPSQR